MGRESKYESVLSWADEVEMEEEEAQAQVHLKQKLNPFGSARPREVVLQERGIDWRNLDQGLQQTSNSRNRAQNEKQSKENIPGPYARASAKKQCEVPWVPLAPQSQIPVIFSPPLRYPHKNAIPRLLEEPSICYNPYGLDNWQQNFQCKNRLEELGLPVEAPRNGKRFREPAACKNQQERSSSAYERRRRLNAENLVGSPLVYERRATPLVRQDKRWSLANERKWRNPQDDYGRHDSRMETTLSAEFEWEVMGLENGRQKVGGMVMVTSPFTAAAGNGGRVGATQNMKMNIANCGVNHRRRGIELGSNKSGNHRKRT